MKNTLDNFPISLFELEDLKNLLAKCHELLPKGKEAAKLNPENESIRLRAIMLETTMGLNNYLVNDICENYRRYARVIPAQVLRKNYEDCYNTLQSIVEAYDGENFLNE